MSKTLLRNGHLVTASDDYTADILIDGERVVAIGQDLTAFAEGARVLDASDKYVFPGAVVCFPDVPGLKVPHMGWNQLRVRRKAPPLADFPEGSSVYFVHSYYARPRDERLVATETDYPTPFASSVWHENVFATQFHPEKSQRLGLAMLKRFAEWK